MDCKDKPEMDSKMDISAMGGEQDDNTQFPICVSAVSNTLKFMVNRVHQMHLQAEEEDLILAGLRMFVAAHADKSVNFTLYNLQSLIYEMFDCLEVYRWAEQRRQKLVHALHMREFYIFDQFSCVKALVDPSNIKGSICFAILQSLHGVEPDKVEYVTELRAAHLGKLPPGPVDWAELSPDHIYLSLQVLADCVSCVAAADAEDPALYAGLVRCLYRMQHRLPRMSVLDVNPIKTLICHLSFLWKALIRDSLEKQGNFSFMDYMEDLVNN